MNNGSLIRSLYIAFFLFLASSRASSEGLPFEIPVDPENTDIYLVTVDIGDDLASRFGHTILRVFDHNNGRQYNFNWGVFDFDEDNFALKFYRGQLLYRVALQSWPRTVDFYRHYDKRSVVQDKLNLTTKQKQLLYERIAWNAKPENIAYKYHHFYNNCSTRIRDYIDEILGGKISQGIGLELSGRSFRDHVRTSMDGLWWADIGLEITTNALFDLRLTKWDEMFLPKYLREYLMEHPAIDDNGNEIPGVALLSDPEQIVKQPPLPSGFPPLVTFGLLFGVPILSSLGMYFAKRSRNHIRGVPIRLAGLGFLLLGTWSGLFGMTMLLNWTVSGHTDLYHNANLWLFFPIDWLFAAVGLKWLVLGKKTGQGLWQKLLNGTAWAHIFGVVICFVLWATGIIDQDVSLILGVFGPLVLAMSGLWLIVSRDATQQTKASQ